MREELVTYGDCQLCAGEEGSNEKLESMRGVLVVRRSLCWVNMMRCVARGGGGGGAAGGPVHGTQQPPSPARPRLHFPALICLTISGHFTHTQSTYNHKKWKLIKHNKSRFNHIFTFANTLTNTLSTAGWSHLCLSLVWCGGSSGGVRVVQCFKMLNC